MHRAIRISLLAAAVPLALWPTAQAQICRPVHRHVMTKVSNRLSHRPAGLGVAVDETRLVAFAKPVKTLFVGNPSIVDVSMIDNRHAFLLGKTFGVTNLIALSPDGEEISNQQVTVLNNGAAVTVNRGADQFNYMCTPAHCETAPRPGDPNVYVNNTENAATTHEATGNTAGANVQAQQASN